ncbi:glycerophosphodiester phosphodiesterase family protein [Tropicibacter oceani]|uniref:Glycerophosphodiester phosphodiesterase family protein n=1 Tax=Tropicibacter oceani TaxID=3058420 RepID=A0ABY8QMV0_9RHOB|nr:glycerophosphodiester phosphodiesterase family protein [Tropicibacter oceani]WGW05788.1 glycerophosphodiester phosphodiesterase family protein [Tropicibacter oceani]
MMPTLPQSLLDRPIAHRAYHDAHAGRPENSRAAIVAAIEAGYGIEMDLQLSSDGQAMVFHDYDLKRLTVAKGAIRQRTAAELGTITLRYSDETVPSLVEVLDLVAGRVPLLIELKDQDGAMGPNVGPLEEATAAALKPYQGEVALMSFNPHSARRMAELAPDRPRGITTCSYSAKDWLMLNKATRDRLRAIPDFDSVPADFISHKHKALNAPRVQELRARGVPILCWTIRSPTEEAAARLIADNVTFEGYVA